MSIETIADTNAGISTALRHVARELDDEWHKGERSAVVDLNDLIEVLRRVAVAIHGEE